MSDDDPLMRVAILTALAEAGGRMLDVEDLRRRAEELHALGEAELRRHAAAVRARERN